MFFLLGYQIGRITSNNDENLKSCYVNRCQNELNNMRKEYISNRSMYKEFRRGFLKAYKDNEDAKNAL